MTNSHRLRVDQVPVETVTGDVVAAMWRLYDEHYDNVRRSVFEADLLEKSSVSLARDAASGKLVGFSTAMIYRHRYCGRAVGGTLRHDVDGPAD